MNSQVLSIVIAFFGSSLLNLAQAIQKIGMDTPNERMVKKWGIWGLGTIFMMIAPLIIQYATSLGGASLVGAMSGTGLAILVLFSRFVMKEEIRPNELAGVAVILAASVLIGVFSAKGTVQSTINLFSLFLFIGIISAVFAVLLLVSLKMGKLTSIVLGGFSGAVGGFVTLLQKVTMSNPTGASSIFTNPFFYTWVAVSLVSFLILQMSYKKDKAIRIVPAFWACFIIVPVLGGVICFREVLNFFQWAGIALIVCGVFLITVKRDAKAEKNKEIKEGPNE